MNITISVTAPPPPQQQQQQQQSMQPIVRRRKIRKTATPPFQVTTEQNYVTIVKHYALVTCSCIDQIYNSVQYFTARKLKKDCLDLKQAADVFQQATFDIVSVDDLRNGINQFVRNNSNSAERIRYYNRRFSKSFYPFGLEGFVWFCEMVQAVQRTDHPQQLTEVNKKLMRAIRQWLEIIQPFVSTIEMNITDEDQIQFCNHFRRFQSFIQRYKTSVFIV